jgi:hypothetical protein
MVGNMGHFIQPALGAMIFNAFGFSALFVVYAGAYLAAAVMWVVIDPRKTFYREDGAAVEPVGFEVVTAEKSEIRNPKSETNSKSE